MRLVDIERPDGQWATRLIFMRDDGHLVAVNMGDETTSLPRDHRMGILLGRIKEATFTRAPNRAAVPS